MRARAQQCRRERARRFHHRIVPDPGESLDVHVGPLRRQLLDHRPHHDRVGVAPDHFERRRMKLDRARPARLVLAALLDVADRPREQTAAAVVRHECRRRRELVGRRHAAGRARRGERGLDELLRKVLGADGLVRHGQQHLLAVGELREWEVDASVREDTDASPRTPASRRGSGRGARPRPNRPCRGSRPRPRARRAP